MGIKRSGDGVQGGRPPGKRQSNEQCEIWPRLRAMWLVPSSRKAIKLPLINNKVTRTICQCCLFFFFFTLSPVDNGQLYCKCLLPPPASFPKCPTCNFNIKCVLALAEQKRLCRGFVWSDFFSLFLKFGKYSHSDEINQLTKQFLKFQC